MEFVALTDIEEDNRQRIHYDEMKIVDLADSILENDLLHPLTLREGSNVLVAGGRRKRALELLHRRGEVIRYAGRDVPPGHAPVNRMPERSVVEYLEAELAENIAREDLSWAERSAAVARLHELRQAQREAKGETQTITDTAREIKGDTPTGSTITSTREDLILASHLEDPDIAKAKTKKEALKTLREKLDRQAREAKARAFLQQAPKAETLYRIHQGDCLAVMQDLELSGVNCVVSDPPYGLNAHAFGGQAQHAHAYDDSYATWQNLMKGYAEALYKATAAEAHLFIFCTIENWTELSMIFTTAGFDVWPRPLIWYKGNNGTLPRPEHGPRYTYEAILFATKGNKKIKKVTHDVLTFQPPQAKTHAAEKPVELYTELLSVSVDPGDLVFDGFAGSGPIFPAARSLQCRAVGIELDPANVALCLDRIKGA